MINPEMPYDRAEDKREKVRDSSYAQRRIRKTINKKLRHLREKKEFYKKEVKKGKKWWEFWK